MNRALAAGVLVRAGHGRYVLPEVDAAARTAHAMNGVLCLTSAALHHGWEVKTALDQPHVLVPRKRNVPDHLRRAVVLHRRDLGPDDVSAGATSRELKDVRRYTLLAASGWMALRFTCEDVMFRPDRVEAVLTRAVAVRARALVRHDLRVAA